ncbi:TraB/GumN family protein [Thaumasiovibrio subtropicus]|uniref:TraB/GumN family protein n=1 Tax=Thaumasiovibrio subtropicus TaxID=1891207 RepID=UPI000B360696|nr:TraB/GumN family protein [Thaumasiovibrio subtropicus]
MIIWIKRLLTSALLAFPFVSPLSAASSPTLWLANSESSTFLLMGSVHVGRPDMYPLPQEIHDAMARKYSLVVEADILSGIVDQGRYTGPKTSQALSAQQLESLRELASSLQIPFPMLLRSPPWQVALQLQFMQAMKMGLMPQWGVDLTLLKQAQKKNIPIIELESVDYQMQLLKSLPDHGVPLLVNTIDEWHLAEKAMACIVEAWSAGDLSAFDELLAASSIDKATDDALIFQRNRNWAEKIATEFPAGDYLVVVGMMHMVGPKGLPALLEKRGFSVREISAQQKVDCIDALL